MVVLYATGLASVNEFPSLSHFWLHSVCCPCSSLAMPVCGRLQWGDDDDEQVGHPVLSCEPNEVNGRAYYRPATATDTVYFFCFLVRASDLLIAVGILSDWKKAKPDWWGSTNFLFPLFFIIEFYCCSSSSVVFFLTCSSTGSVHTAAMRKDLPLKSTL